MDVISLHRRTVEEWQRRLAAVTDAQWQAATPCSEWDVKALVNHVMSEDVWTKPLLEGKTIAEVGDQFDGDLLGEQPADAARAAGDEAIAASAEHAPRNDHVHLSFGDFPSQSYLQQLAADHLIHSWDLARATGQDDALDPELVSEIAAWFPSVEDMVRGSGMIADRTPPVGDPQSDLLAAYGRRFDWSHSVS